MADSLDLTFTAAAAAAAGPEAAAAAATESIEVELVPGGSRLSVTGCAVGQYVDALLEHKLLGGCSKQVRGLRGGGGRNRGPRCCNQGCLMQALHSAGVIWCFALEERA
jgi:hypothetical protein